MKINIKKCECECGKKASKQCLHSRCFKCCDNMQRRSIKNKDLYNCKYHEVYKKSKDKYNLKYNPIILNRTTPPMDKIKKPHKKGFRNNILIKFNKDTLSSDKSRDKIIKTLEKMMNMTLKKHFKNYSARINIITK